VYTKESLDQKPKPQKKWSMGSLLMCLQLLFMAFKNRHRDQEKHAREVLQTMNCSS
jgi:hypothetical protein